MLNFRRALGFGQFQFYSHNCGVVADLPGGDKQRILNYVDGIFIDKPHISVKARPRVPPRRFFLVVQPHRNEIFFSELYKFCGVDVKRCVPVRPLSGELSVHVNFGVAHCAVEFDEHKLPFLTVRSVDNSAVPPYAETRQCTCSSGAKAYPILPVLVYLHRLEVYVHIKRLAYRPIVRNHHRFPLSVIKLH